MNNADVAGTFAEIAELLELKNESRFRIRAYENAARTLGGLTEDVRALAASGDLRHIKGIGDALAQKIEELLATGHVAYLEQLRSEFPPGVRSLLAVPGVGPSLARRVYQELNVQSLADLRQVAESGALAALPGFGEKSAENVIRALGRVNKQETRISIGKALPLVEELIILLRQTENLSNITPAGSLRRWAPTIGDIDLMATSSSPEIAMDAFVHLPVVSQILGHGRTKSAIVTDNGIQVDLRIVETEHFGSLVQHFTGSKQHNVELREFALHRGVSLNEYGITTSATGEQQTFRDEVAFYAALGLAYIPPELREGQGEIEAARNNALPVLIEQADIMGELHCHTTWSDGSRSVEEMAIAAKERGYRYLAITDHSSGIGVAGGLSVERLQEQMLEIRAVDQRIEGIRLLTGTEVDIRRDGTLDFPDEILSQLDWVIASIHSGFNQPEAEMTARMVRAINNPHVDAIAHPTGRLIGKRAPYDVDLEAVFRAAASSGTALEINSFPERLDLVDAHARRAADLGVSLVINTDAHAPVHLDNIRYGVAMARRGWVEARQVLNTHPLSELLERLTSGGKRL